MMVMGFIEMVEGKKAGGGAWAYIVEIDDA